MQRIAFKMQLHPGQEEVYKKRHDEIWGDLVALLKGIGIEAYSIFLDERTLELFAILHIKDPGLLDGLPEHEVMQKWWGYMSDIMEVNMDRSPVVIPLKEVFYLP